MTDFQQQALKLAAQQQSPAWLSGLRAQAANDWLSAQWPTRKTEHWKYTPLASLQKNALSLVNGKSGTANADWKKSIEFINVDAIRLVFINGVFDSETSSVLPENITLFSKANYQQQQVIERYLGKIVEGKQHLFAALNSAWLDEGLLINVPRNQVMERAIYVVHVSTSGHQSFAANHRLLVVLEDSAQAEIIEHFVSTDERQNSFVNSLTEIIVGENAHLQHYRLNIEEENIQHLGAVHANLLRNARLRGFTLALGSTLKRIDYQINHRGQGAELDLQGVYLPRNNQMVDYHSNVQHWVPHCTTNEVFRGIIADSAQAIFNGRIYIHKDAQKTLAELSNKNLLTSNKAEVNTKPELEIYADDVKCAHGATVSQLNATALYYLQSRGISRAEAEVMMSFGFINELLEQISEIAVHDYLFPQLAELFGRDQTLLTMVND